MNAHQKFETIAFSRNPTSKPVGADARAELLKDPGFGRVFTDHMVTIRWTKDRGWHDAQVRAREPISLDPAAAVLHYGQEIFEGLKAYTRSDGSIALFRPDQNARRFRASAVRMALPELPEACVHAGHRRAREDRPGLDSGRRRQPLSAPLHVRDRGLSRRPSVPRMSLHADRQLGRLLFQGRREGRHRLAQRSVHARSRGRHRRSQMRRQLCRQPARPVRGDRARLRSGRVPRRRRASLGRRTRRHERLLRLRRRLDDDATAERHDPARHHPGCDHHARPQRRPHGPRGALQHRAMARRRSERQAARGFRLRYGRGRLGDRQDQEHEAAIS